MKYRSVIVHPAEVGLAASKPILIRPRRRLKGKAFENRFEEKHGTSEEAQLRTIEKANAKRARKAVRAGVLHVCEVCKLTDVSVRNTSIGNYCPTHLADAERQMERFYS